MAGKVRIEIDEDTRELVKDCIYKGDTYDSVLRYMVKLFRSYKAVHGNEVTNE